MCQVKEMIQFEVIKPSKSQLAPAPIVLVKISDGSLRLCIDCRKLNAVTMIDAFLCPHISDSLDSAWVMVALHVVLEVRVPASGSGGSGGNRQEEDGLCSVKPTMLRCDYLPKSDAEILVWPIPKTLYNLPR